MHSGQQQFINLIQGKKVLYIATKNSDYIRIVQEIKLLKENASHVRCIVSKNKSYIKRILHVYKELLFTSSKEYDMIMVGFMSQMILPWWNFKFRKKTVIEDFFISIYDTLVDDRKKFKSNSLIGKLLHWMDRKAIQSAEYIITDTKAHRDYFKEEFQTKSHKYIPLYLHADESIYHPMNVEKPEQWRDKFLVLYFGSILPLQGVDVILQAIDQLKEDKDIHFLMIGPIDEKYKKIQSDTVTYIDWLDQKELAKYIAFSDLCLGGHFSESIGKADRTIPGKVYIYEAMQKPMILGDSKANRELFREDESHFFVKRGKAAALKKSILKSIKQMKID